MELKISKIQWKKVLACVLTLCMAITMVQVPVNAEETAQPVNSPKHFDVWDLEYYEETATFFDAAEDRTAIDVQPMEENKTYTVDPTTGYYDAKWFSFTPSKDGMYTFKANEEQKDSIACLLEKTSSGEYRYIECNNSYEQNDYTSYDLFYIKADLQKDKTYYLCTGWSTKKNKEQYSFTVSKDTETELSSTPVTYNNKLGDKIYTFTAPKAGCYMLKYEWKNNGNPVAWASGNYKVTHNNEKMELINGSNKNTENTYYLFCEAGEKYYLNQGGFYVDDEVVDVNISVISKNIKDTEVSKLETIASGTTGEIFKFKLDENGYCKLNLNWHEEGPTRSTVGVTYSIINEKGESIIDSDYFNSEYEDGPESFYGQKGKNYYLVIKSLDCTDYEGIKVNDFSIELGIVQDKDNKEEITTTNPGKFISGNSVNKVFKFTAKKSGYINVKFASEKDMNDEWWLSARIIDSKDNSETLYLSRKNNFFIAEGDTYYIEIKRCSFEDNSKIPVQVKISELPIEEVSYSNVGKINIGSENKIFKFKAQYTGKHVLKYSWDNEDAKLYCCETSIMQNGTIPKYYEEIKDRKTVSYQAVNCKKGETYYFDFKEFAFGLRKTYEDINVDMSFGIAYYNGKTDIGTIENEKPLIPGQDGGSTEKPGSGSTENPGSGSTETPGSGSTETPGSGSTETPGSGSTENPGSGSTENPGSGSTENPGSGSTETPGSGSTIKPGQTTNNNTKPATPTKKPANNATKKPAVIKVSKIKVTALSNKIAAGKKVKLTATVAPAKASNKAVKWKTSNKKVAVVSKSGVVTVNKKAAGKSVIITAIAADGSGARATYKIKVMKDAVKKVTITGKNTVKAGKKLSLKAKVAAGKKANKKLVWSSSNVKFATVNQKGVVTTKKAGKGKKVKITAKATDGSNKKKVFVIKIK